MDSGWRTNLANGPWVQVRGYGTRKSERYGLHGAVTEANNETVDEDGSWE